MKVEKVYFGNVSFYRAYCSSCKSKALIVNGKLKCCGKKVERPDSYIKKRESEAANARRIPYATKIKIIEMQRYRCIYCGTEIDYDTTHIDHFVPWSYVTNNAESNLYASCGPCNLVKYCHIFESIDHARIYILEKRGILK